MFRGRTPRTPVGPVPVRPVPARTAKGNASTRAATRVAIGQAVEHVEMLETRRLLTTLVGGQTFDYFDQDLQSVRIRLVGSITAEFTGARVRKTDNTVVIRDLIPAPIGNQTPPTEGADLFNIYIAAAGPDAGIIITRIGRGGAADRTASPYSGSVGAIRAFDNDPAVDSDTITPDSTGSVYIGTRTLDLDAITGDDEANIPITFNRTRQALGVRPASRGLFAGITSAPGVSVDKLLIGGTITGIINLGGNVNTFYAGNILTGDASGLSTIGRGTITNNFSVAGDLQNLYVAGSIGTTDPGFFRTGVQLRVGGRLGNVHVGNSSTMSVSVIASPSAPSNTDPAQEAEYVLQPGEFAQDEFLLGLLSGATVNNNSADTAPFMYSTGEGQAMRWSGTLQNAVTADVEDDYSLPLLAGQSAAIQVVSLFGSANVGVYDPLGRLVTTDIPGPTGSTNQQQFLFTAKLPGIYRVALSENAFGLGTNVRGDDVYTLTATATGNVTFGGASVEGETHFRESGNGVAVRVGDLGGWYGVGDVSGLDSVEGLLAGSPINISRGNIRAIYGANVGVEEDANVDNRGELLDLIVPRGSVGYIRANGTNGNVAINRSAVDAVGDPIASRAIGGEYQRVEATNGDVDSALVANGSIGSIIATGIASNTLSYFQPTFSANTDRRGSDGDIDMIYVSGDVGATFSGPAIYNGLSGNVKYFHVGGTVRRDTFFGTSISSTQTYQPGQSVRLVDDSGAVALLTPTTQYTTVTSGGTDAGSVGPTDTLPRRGVGTINLPPTSSTGTGTTITTTADQGALTLTTYPVRGTGGVILINAASTTSFTVTSLSNVGGAFDITDLTTAASGSPILTTSAGTVTDVNGRVRTVSAGIGYPQTAADDTTSPAGTVVTTGAVGTTPRRTNAITFNGLRPINVFNIVGNNVTTLTNSTDGEIASANLASLGVVSAKNLGRIAGTTQSDVVVPTNVTGLPTGDADFGSPTDGFTRAIEVTGSALGITARDGVGNVTVVGTLGTLQPNSDRRNSRGVLDGISGLITAGTINTVDIGEGLAFGGSGSTQLAGIFTGQALNALIGNDADIRAPIISGGTIGTLTLNNGSIINTRIGVVDTAGSGVFTVNGFVLPEPGAGFSLSSINITGSGGIIGSQLILGTFASINVSGFGILTTTIRSTSTNRSNGSISAAGLGIRFVNISSGTSINSIAATGNGRVLDVTQYSAAVRQTGGARRRRFDAYSGRLLDSSNDLNRLLGTTASRPKIPGVTNSGVIQDLAAVGIGNLNSLKAYALLSADTTTSLNSSAFPNRLDFANTIGSIDVTRAISGLSVRTGTLESLNVGETIQRAQISAAGRIDSVNVGYVIRGSTSFLAQGTGGTIGSIVARGSFYGTVIADSDIDEIGAGTLSATIASSGTIGAISVNEDVLSGTSVRARRRINKITVGGDIKSGATFDSTGVGRLRVGGRNDGTFGRPTT